MKKKWKPYRDCSSGTHKDYKDKRQKDKNIVPKTKKKVWRAFDTKIEGNQHTKRKLFLKVLRNMLALTQKIKDESQNILNSKK